MAVPNTPNILQTSPERLYEGEVATRIIEAARDCIETRKDSTPVTEIQKESKLVFELLKPAADEMMKLRMVDSHENRELAEVIAMFQVAVELNGRVANLSPESARNYAYLRMPQSADEERNSLAAHIGTFTWRTNISDEIFDHVENNAIELDWMLSDYHVLGGNLNPILLHETDFPVAEATKNALSQEEFRRLFETSLRTLIPSLTIETCVEIANKYFCERGDVLQKEKLNVAHKIVQTPLLEIRFGSELRNFFQTTVTLSENAFYYHPDMGLEEATEVVRFLDRRVSRKDMDNTTAETMDRIYTWFELGCVEGSEVPPVGNIYEYIQVFRYMLDRLISWDERQAGGEVLQRKLARLNVNGGNLALAYIELEKIREQQKSGTLSIAPDSELAKMGLVEKIVIL